MVNVTVEARNDVDDPGVVKLQAETWELNVWATTDELWKLAGIEKTDWIQRRTLQVGTCAKLRFGGTNETARYTSSWVITMSRGIFGVTVPLSTIHNLLVELGEPPEAAPPPFGPTLF